MSGSIHKPTLQQIAALHDQRHGPIRRMGNPGPVPSAKAMFYDAYPPGVDRLSASITINGAAVTPLYRYKLGDAAAGGLNPWTYPGDTSGNLALQTGTAPTYNYGSPFRGTNDDSCFFTSGGYYKAANTTFGDITTPDIVFEIIYKNVVTGSTAFLVSRRTSAGGAGYISAVTATGAFHFAIQNAAYLGITSDAQSDRCWYHAIVFINRDENSTSGGQIYINGVASGSGVNFSAQSGSLTNSQYFIIGANSVGSSPYPSAIAYMAMYTQASWIAAGAGGQAECATVAANRFADLTGQKLSKAKGTAYPTTMHTRASVAMGKKRSSNLLRYYGVGNNFPRVCDVLDITSSTYKTGLRIGEQRTNLFTYSDVSNAAWTKSQCTVSSGTAYDGPEKHSDMRGIVADADDELHSITCAPTLTADNYVIGVNARPGNKDWLYLSDDTVANAYAYFNTSTGAVGTTGAGVIQAWIEGPFTPSGYRCAIKVLGTEAAHTIRIAPAHADGDNDFAGDAATVNLYVSLPQCSAGEYPAIPIKCAGSAVTRAADSPPIYKGDDGNLGGVGSNANGMVKFRTLLNNADTTAATLLSISDGAAATDEIKINIEADDTLSASTAKSGGNAGAVTATGDMTDGCEHIVELKWKTNNLILNKDKVKGTPDTEIDPPINVDQIRLTAADGTGQHGGIVYNLELYPKRTV